MANRFQNTIQFLQESHRSCPAHYQHLLDIGIRHLVILQSFVQYSFFNDNDFLPAFIVPLMINGSLFTVNGYYLDAPANNH